MKTMRSAVRSLFSKKSIVVILGLTLAVFTLFLFGCDSTDSISSDGGDTTEHVHNYIEVAEDAYLCERANCRQPASYFVSCKECGERGTKTFEYGEKTEHRFESMPLDGAIKTSADCENPAVYYYTCSECGTINTEMVFEDGRALGHNFGHTENDEYLAASATCMQGALYYESCARCGTKGKETFSAGEPSQTHHYEEIVDERYICREGTCAESPVYYMQCSVCHRSSSGDTNETFADVNAPKIEHDFSRKSKADKYKKESADCLHGNVYYYSCRNCGITSEGTKCEQTFEDGRYADHNYEGNAVSELTKRSDANCLEEATYYKSCVVCGDVNYEEYFEVGEPLGHDLMEIIDENYLVSAATCTALAVYRKVCSRCNAEGETFEYGTPKEHNFSEIITDKALISSADCENNAVYSYSCIDCGAISYTMTFNAEDSSLGHAYTAERVSEENLYKKATCSEKAKYFKSCERCGNKSPFDDELYIFEAGEYAPHTWVECDGMTATCLNYGYEPYHYCSVCHDSTYRKIPALGHDYIYHEKKAATCVEEGYNSYATCSRCEYTTYDSNTKIPALGHDYIYHEKKAATCEEDGYGPYSTCSRCDYSNYIVINAKGHNIVQGDAQSVTCESDGWNAYEYCNNSGCDYTTKVVIKATGHDWKHFDKLEPTCTEQGHKEYDECANCHKSTYDFIPASGHQVVETKEVVLEPTCTEKGSYKMVRTCSKCNVILVSQTYTMPMIGHEEKQVTVIQPTCKECGSDNIICSRCNEVLRTLTTSAMGHDFNDKRTCLHCGKVLQYLYDKNDGNYLYYGSYPQSKVTDEAKVSELNALINGVIPTEENANGWDSYGYYENGVVANYMWYIDVGVGEEVFRGVYFTKNRMGYTEGFNNIASHQEENGYLAGTVYWFRFEPLKWRILNSINGRALIYCLYSIDSQQYHYEDGINGTNVFEDENGNKTIPLNYAESDIRRWLNETFYETAFNDLQHEIVLTTQLNNDYESTTSKATSFGMEHYYDCGITSDNVFILSRQEYYSYVQYDHVTNKTDREWANVTIATDYAKAQGIYVDSDGSTSAMLRSLYYSNTQTEDHLTRVSVFVTKGPSRTCTNVECGIHPAMWIEVED